MRSPRRWRPYGASLLPLLLSAALVAAQAAEGKVIQDGSQVSIEYTLSLSDGSTASTNVGKDPLVYEQGSGKLLPALEQQLAGLKVDDVKQVTLSPDKGYGAVDATAYRDVSPEVVPEDARHVGAQLIATDRDGRSIMVRVREVHEDRIVLDFNHPLAGETLTFRVRILDIQ